MSSIPEDFRCPISLELMADPVILATGQTYDRPSIQRWLDAGHRTCPKTYQELQDTRLIPNYALRSLISQWAEAHGVEIKKRPLDFCISRSSSSENSKEAQAQLKNLVDGLVRKLSVADDARRDAIKEIRVLAKESKEIRACIAEAGAIARVLPLVTCGDPQNEENAVMLLFNLSVDDENKVGLVAEGALDAIVCALKRGSTESRANAALTLLSLAMVDVNKATIGSRRDAIPALVKLIKDGTTRGQKASILALYSLSSYPQNRSKAVSAGIVPLLLSKLCDEGSSETAEPALALLDLLITDSDARVAIAKQASVTTLVKFIRFGSIRSKESAAAILCAICVDSRKNALLAYNAGVLEHVQSLKESGTERAKRKASILAKVLQESNLSSWGITCSKS